MKNMILTDIPTLEYASTEAINTLATNVTFSGSQYKSIMMTSCTPNEGKSYISFNVVRALANMGYSALLVDADLRKSVFLSRYDVRIKGSRLGLTHYLAGHCAVDDILYQSNIPNVFVIPSGKEVINSLPLLTSSMFLALLNDMKSSFDFIIVDAPPVGLVIDAAMISNVCDATIIVVSGEQVSRRELGEAVQQIEKSGCTILGAVLNKVMMATHKSRKYYYKSYYSHYSKDEYFKKPDDAAGQAVQTARRSPLSPAKTAREQGSASPQKNAEQPIAGARG